MADGIDTTPRAVNASDRPAKLTADERRARKLAYMRQRYIDNKDAILAKNRQWCADNPDKKRASDRKQYDANREKILAREKARHEANRDARLVRTRAYWSQNKDVLNEKRRNRRAEDPMAARDAARAWFKKPEAKEKMAIWRKAHWIKNKDAISKRNKTWREANKDAVSATARARRLANKDVVNEQVRMWRRSNPGHARARYKNDQSFMLMCRLRARLQAAVRRARVQKRGRTSDLLGCDVTFLRSHIEAQFTDGMSWENYGEWHIDHIRPCVTFDLSDAGQQRECFHFNNLRPLWAAENLARPRRNWRPTLAI